MKVRIKTPDWQPLKYETSWACWFDFKCVEDLTFAPWEFKLVETWVVVEIPKWYFLQLVPRSSTFKKHWLIQVNWAWLVDQDYCGDTDTLKYPYLNISQTEQKIEAGTRIWQWIFIPCMIADFEVVETMWENKDRWWFWTTWLK